VSTLSTFFDMVYVQVSGSPGTGNATLGSALIGFQTPAAAGITNGTPVSYRMTDGTNWETAHGTINVSGSTYTLVRGVDTIESSNSNSLVNFTASSGITVLICPLSQDINAWVSAGAAQSFSSTQAQQARTNIATAPSVTTFPIQPVAYVSCPSSGVAFAASYMAGFGGTFAFTPSRSGTVLLSVISTLINFSGLANNDIVRLFVAYGTGTAPSIGAIASGTLIAQIVTTVFNSSYVLRQTGGMSAALSLTVGTAYWFDLSVNDGTTASVVLGVNNTALSILEF
jgi:hypothetical protein